METTDEYLEQAETEQTDKAPPPARKRHKWSDTNAYLKFISCIIAAAVFGTVIGVVVISRSSRPHPGVTDDFISAAESEYPDIQTEQPVDPPAALPAGANDIIDVIAQARLNGMTNRCYLTFDDGPSSVVTGEILDTLNKYGIKATFFELGQRISEFPGIAKRVYDEGHLIANHSYSHDYNSLYASEESFVNEILATESAIKETTGQQEIFRLVRFPGGSYNAGDHAAEKQVYKQTLANMGYYYCDWNTINGDAEGAGKDASQLVETFKSSAESYISQNKNIIVLMHDSDAKQSTADSLESIILYLIDRGYSFHRLDDIIGL